MPNSLVLNTRSLDFNMLLLFLLFDPGVVMKLSVYILASGMVQWLFLECVQTWSTRRITL